MIILSVGMPRAGSGWHYNLIHDLMARSGAKDAREIRERYHLENILTEVNCNIGVLSLRRLALIVVPSIIGNTFVIKAHAGPTPWSRTLAHLGQLRITYIYRDPRDAMLSAYEYGQRALQKGHPNAFSHLKDFETSLKFIMDYVKIWEKWMQEDNVLRARYEDLLTNYDEEAARLLDFLGLDLQQETIRAVVEKYRPAHASQGNKGLHFYKGKIGRFREVYTHEQQQILANQLGLDLQRMGYGI
jgi:hypothetical protein